MKTGKQIETLQARAASIMEEMVPHINDSSFSKDDRDQIDSILLLLHSLNSHIATLTADIELFDYAESHTDIMMRWSPIACRDAAMTIWHFQDALDYMLRALKRCPPIKTKERERALRSVIGRAAVAFPKKMRHVTAHATSHIGTPQARKQNALRGTSVILQNSRIGRKVIHSVEGRELSFEMSNATIQTLKTIRNIVFAIFRDKPTSDPGTTGQQSPRNPIKG
jgi:hypothetical protein